MQPLIKTKLYKLTTKLMTLKTKVILKIHHSLVISPHFIIIYAVEVSYIYRESLLNFLFRDVTWVV